MRASLTTLGRSTPEEGFLRPRGVYGQVQGGRATTPDYRMENGTGVQVPMFPITPDVKGTAAREMSVRLGDLSR